MSRRYPSAAIQSSSPVERRSVVVFSVTLLLVLLSVAFPEMAPQALQGILWTGAGGLMILLPPEVRMPRVWLCLAIGFVGFSLIGFLPVEWFHASPWRGDLAKLGLDTGVHGFVQPQLAAEVMAGFAATALTALFLLGHRIGSRLHYRLALGFALGIGIWTIAALGLHQPGKLFGFFPNRNHVACLLVMGTFVGLGCFTQAIRMKSAWKIALSAIPMIVCSYALYFVSESRAGVFLMFAGLLAWIPLNGFRHFQGNVGKALVLILIAVIGTFSVVDSPAKKRVTTTLGQLATSENGNATPPKSPFAVESAAPSDPPLDGRVAIFQDTWEMIRHESWTGVGPGQFAQVFPQYREKTYADNNARCLHPESDWLMMLAETGWPATLCLATGLIAVFFAAVKQARRGRSRFLQMGTLVAAMLLCLHGLFDVPGHRVGLAWAAALLLAISLRRPEREGQETDSDASHFARQGWRLAGLILALAGIGLIHAQWSQKPILPSVQANQWMNEAKALHDADQAAYEKANAGGLEYQPAPFEDPLEAALWRVEQAIGVSPLEPHRHYIRGAFALHFDDKDELAARAFSIQRRLVPTRINLVMEQAQAWMVRNPQEVIKLWTVALRRASAEESRFPGHPYVTKTYGTILQAAGTDEALFAGAFELARDSPGLLMQWVRSAPASLLDQEMPRLLSAPYPASDRQALFQLWQKKGSPEVIASFILANPSLGLSFQ